MKAIICFVAIIAVAVAFPAQEGAAYTNEAIRQAQSSHLIPQNAQIQKVESSIPLNELENIPGNQRVDLYAILGSEFPSEVVQNLQRQIDSVGRN
ncbi:uncharacterized protein LOC116341007 [Contarinia nasturtii]|uniref:uncharacterized protein LOC116341007 n=1 Tax=Contarinia nasturtii TaxID=265458 RepID=UPI0012D40EB5|nr:uncharacterized protein LOC116341007 [Contarinia nasturtii]